MTGTIGTAGAAGPVGGAEAIGATATTGTAGTGEPLFRCDDRLGLFGDGTFEAGRRLGKIGVPLRLVGIEPCREFSPLPAASPSPAPASGVASLSIVGIAASAPASASAIGVRLFLVPDGPAMDAWSPLSLPAATLLPLEIG